MRNSKQTFYPKATRATAIRGCLAVFFSIVFIFFLFRVSLQFQELSFCHPNLPNISSDTKRSDSFNGSQGWAETTYSVASQGKIWKPTRWRTFSGSRLADLSHARSTLSKSDISLRCDRWAVVTTIFSPTQLLDQLRALPEWCLVVVGDYKTKEAEWRTFVGSSKTTVYLSPKDQDALLYKSLKHLPWNHFGRKNIGYLFAIQHGAQLIWDTDDDNVLRDPASLTKLANFAVSSSPSALIPSAAGDHHLWNPYLYFRPIQQTSAQEVPICWPRGFPLEYVKDASAAASDTGQELNVSKVGVFQSLANNDPDVDAIYRLTKEMPLSFLARDAMIALRPGRFAPFNAQATLWKKEAFWGMLLPVTVHGRVSDIWRSYFMQRLMKDVNLHLSFTSPLAVQYRNVHSLVADLQSEVPLYTKANELTKWLRQWNPARDTAGSLVKRMEQLYVDLYEIGILEEQDVLLCQAWLSDLAAMGIEKLMIENDVSKSSREPKMSPLAKAQEPNLSSTAKVAVCVSGQVRTLEMEVTDPEYPGDWHQMKRSLIRHPNITVAESIQRNLFPKLGNPDVFMYVSTRESEREPRAGNMSTCEPLRPKGGQLFCDVPKEEDIHSVDVDAWDEFAPVLGNHLRREESIQGMLQQLKGLFECHKMIKKHTFSTGIEYDWIVRLRPDDYVHSFPSLDTLSLASDQPTVWFSNKKTCCCGNEDKLGIGRMKWMREYFDRFLYVQQVPWNYPTRWNAEKFALNMVTRYGIQMVSHPEIQACTVKPSYRKRRSTP